MIAPLAIEAIVIGPLRHSPGRSLLAVIAIALGIALGLAIHLINRTAADEISLAARSLYGLADLTVESAAEGFDENLYPRIARTPGVAAASPVVEVEAKLVGRRSPLTLIGVDGFRSRLLQPAFAVLAGSMGASKADSSGPASSASQFVFLSASAARELSLAEGDTFDVQVGVRRFAFEIAAVLPPAALEDRAGIIDIAAAQWTFGRLGRLTRINLRLESGANPGRVTEQLRRFLPASVRVTTPGKATDDALRLSRAYRANLTALALVALFTGGFFVYSTQALATLRRRREFAVLHAIGVTRGEQLVLTLMGSALIGVCAAALGIVAGLAIASVGLSALGAEFFMTGAARLDVHPVEVAVFSVLGMLVAIIGALRPALEAAHVPTASALKAGDVASGQVRTHGWLVLALAVLAAAVLAVPPIEGLPLPGYVSIALLLIATVTAMPSVVRLVLRYAPRGRAVPYQIAIAQIAGTARYATLSVCAILVSFSLMVSMAIMVTSFRDSLDRWTQQILPADMYLRVGYVGHSSHLDQDTVEAIRRLPGVVRIEDSRFARVQVVPERPPATLIARSIDPHDAERSLWLVAETQAPTPPGATPVWVNEAASDLFGLLPGQTLQLPLAGKSVHAFVRGIWRDYEHQAGAFVMNRTTYVQLSGDSAVNSVWLWLRDGVGEQQLRNSIRDLLPAGAEFELRSPRELRALSLDVFDRTFAITYILELVAVLIGLFGIAAGISAQVLARRGELGALRHLGLTRAQIGAMLAIEGAVLGAFGVVAGLLAGFVVSLILIHVVNRQSFHWSMDLAVPLQLLGGLSVALVGAAALIAMLSGRQAMSTDVVRAVKEDW